MPASLPLPWYWGSDDSGPYTVTGWASFTTFKYDLLAYSLFGLLAAAAGHRGLALLPPFIFRLLATTGALTLGLFGRRLFIGNDIYHLKTPMAPAYIALAADVIVALAFLVLSAQARLSRTRRAPVARARASHRRDAAT